MLHTCLSDRFYSWVLPTAPVVTAFILSFQNLAPELELEMSIIDSISFFLQCACDVCSIVAMLYVLSVSLPRKQPVANPPPAKPVVPSRSSLKARGGKDVCDVSTGVHTIYTCQKRAD